MKRHLLQCIIQLYPELPLALGLRPQVVLGVIGELLGVAELDAEGGNLG